MPLGVGTHLGIYEITGMLGAGGMGEVYRATDTKLKREVAIKVLPAAFANEPERLARFQREAELLAALNHPNIASIYGLEDSGALALVMELVEGPTLADRIAQGPIPLEEALSIARQLAEALEFAHEEGIVHRDLKPANIKLAGDESVKILDFGLAKAMQVNASSPGLPNSPTSLELATRADILLGTAGYMSPEQAKGKPVDRRADIWAFGCVLFEILAGQPPFLGEAVADTLAAVIRGEPDWRLLPGATPQAVRTLLRRCLAKSVRQRLQAIGDARIVLDEVLSGRAQPETAPAPQRRVGSRWFWGLAGASIATAVTILAAWALRAPDPAQTRPVTRFAITLPQGQQLAMRRPALALSADGSLLAYVASQDGGEPQLFLWAFDRMQGQALPGTEGAFSPFFSPDGQWIGFLAGDKLKRVAVHGGDASTVIAVGFGVDGGASWSASHSIAFAPYASAIQEVPEAGGESEPLTHFESGETLHRWPTFLPGGQVVLFSVVTTDTAGIAAQRLDSGKRVSLLAGPIERVGYAPSGHLVFSNGTNLMAAPFDRGQLAIEGVPVPVQQGVVSNQFSISDSGTLVYASGGQIPDAPGSTLVWVDRDSGSETPLDSTPRKYNQPRVSPDGTKVAVDVINAVQNMQIWLYDIVNNVAGPFTSEGGVNRHSVWTRDGKRIAFMSNREGPTQIFWKLVDGGGGLERLTSHPATTSFDVLDIPFSFSRDGTLLATVKLIPPNGVEFGLLKFSATGSTLDTTELPLHLAMPSLDAGPQISPDGLWLAYASELSGHGREIYVQAFPGPGNTWQISTDGGNEPQWNPKGGELFYRNGDKMMAVDFDAKSGRPAGRPHELFEGPYTRTNSGYVRADYDVSPDGQRFLMLKAAVTDEATALPPVTQINVVLNWFEELKDRVPTK